MPGRREPQPWVGSGARRPPAQKEMQRKIHHGQWGKHTRTRKRTPGGVRHRDREKRRQRDKRRKKQRQGQTGLPQGTPGAGSCGSEGLVDSVQEGSWNPGASCLPSELDQWRYVGGTSGAAAAESCTRCLHARRPRVPTDGLSALEPRVPQVPAGHLSARHRRHVSQQVAARGRRRALGTGSGWAGREGCRPGESPPHTAFSFFF